MPLPPDLRWLDDLLDVLVDEFIERLNAQEADGTSKPDPKFDQAAA